MSDEFGREPIFLRPANYVYNPRNPVGFALIVASVVFVVAGLGYLVLSSRWSEGELRDVVHGAARSLEARPRKVSLHTGYQQLIDMAIEATEVGPPHGLEVSPVQDHDERGAAARTSDAFEIRTLDTEDPYCMRIRPPEPDIPLLESRMISLSVQVEKGSC